jgi:hypothetical protein
LTVAAMGVNRVKLRHAVFRKKRYGPRAPKAFGVYVAASLGFEARQRFSPRENRKSDHLPEKQSDHSARAAQDRARIVFDCRTANAPAMMPARYVKRQCP